MWLAGPWGGEDCVLRKGLRMVDSLWGSAGPPGLLAGGRAPPDWVCAPCFSDVSTPWEGSLSEWWVWGGVASCKVMPSASCREGRHGRQSFLGWSWLWHKPAE